MSARIKNIIIVGVVLIVLVLVYFFFIKAPSNTAPLVSSSSSIVPGTASSTNGTVAQDFLTLLLSVKNINLNDAIFSDSAFLSLHDSSIVLTPDANPGRPNPFAPIGSDTITTTATPITTATPAATTITLPAGTKPVVGNP